MAKPKPGARKLDEWVKEYTEVNSMPAVDDNCYVLNVSVIHFFKRKTSNFRLLCGSMTARW